MEKILQLLSQHGPFAVISGGLVYLFVLVWRRYNDMLQRQHDAMVADTKAKAKLTEALEDLGTAVEALGAKTGADVRGCQGQNRELVGKISEYIRVQELERAKEEGRREVTGRFQISAGDET